MKLPGIWGCQNGGNWLRAAKLVAGSAVAMSFGLRPTGLIGEIWGLATEEIQALRDTLGDLGGAGSDLGRADRRSRPLVDGADDAPAKGRDASMMAVLTRWPLLELPLFVAIAIGTHLVMSGSQTLLHYSLAHHRLGGALFHKHIRFHHTIYARGHLVSATYRGDDGNNTPYFLIPTILVAGAMYLVLPHDFFLVMAAASAASFYAHVYFDKEYHVEASKLARFAWFRRKQQLHFVHHLHADSNFAVIDFFWDRLLGTYRKPESDL